LIPTGRSAKEIDDGDLPLHRIQKPAVIRRVRVGTHELVVDDIITGIDLAMSLALIIVTLRDEEGNDYDVIACIAGRGFKVRREDMRRLLQATDGKVFTLATVQLLIENIRIREYRIR
jgi:hypothetical protein